VRARSGVQCPPPRCRRDMRRGEYRTCSIARSEARTIVTWTIPRRWTRARPALAGRPPCRQPDGRRAPARMTAAASSNKSDMLLHVFSSGGAGVGRRARQRGGIGHCISTIFTRRKGTSQQYPSRTVDERESGWCRGLLDARCSIARSHFRLYRARAEAVGACRSYLVARFRFERRWDGVRYQMRGSH
jgi:hypothetical protein